MFKAEFISAKNLLEWNIEYNLGLKSVSLKKNHIVLEADQRCDYFYFVLKGCLRLYYLDLEGNQITHWFADENSITTSPFSFFKKEKNILFIETLEETELLFITSDHFKTIIKEVKNAGYEIRKLYAEFAMIFSRRIMDIHTKTAQERYSELLNNHPFLLEKAKLSHIASFLGITQQSLSRIRKNL
ncbi:MAG: Crp/Fnr family transcriptional regulator [Bacteroidota bacterium]